MKLSQKIHKRYLNYKLQLLTLLLVTFLAVPHAQAYGWNWSISSFDTDVTVKTDSSIIVKETIVADYSQEEHHGLLRDIPVRYKTKFGNNLNLRYKILSVTDENGKNWPYNESNDGEYAELQIGDSEKYLSKPSTFIITYEIERAVTYFDDHDELYWNATGTEWEVPIHSAHATVTLPKELSEKDLRTACYTGVYGSSSHDCVAEIKNRKISIQTQDTLNATEGLTVVIGFPKGTVARPSWVKTFLWFLTDNWGYGSPFIVFGILYYLWRTRGRDPKTNRDTIMPIYTPPDNLSPTEIGTIIDESVDMRDITAGIIDLAIRGYLKIIETKEKKFLFEQSEYEFKKLKDFAADKNLKEHERKILLAIFKSEESRKLSDLTNKFYQDLPKIKDQVYNQIVEGGYFPQSPEKIRTTYRTIGLVLIFAIFFGSGFFFSFFSISVPIGLILSALLFLIFAKHMPAKTKKGVDTFYQIKGLEEYINTAEKDRLKFQEKENIFEKLLPYAMTLGIAEKWTKTFEGIYKTAPSWYQSSDPNFGAHFSTYYFLGRLNSLSGNMQSTFQSSPRSSGSGAWGGSSGFGGGGFSGGGFGGGGGGSW